MNWFRYILSTPAIAAAIGAGHREVAVALEAESNFCHQGGRRPGKHPNLRARRPLPGRRRIQGRPSTMSLHVLRDIGLTPTAAQCKGLRVDWRP